MLRNLFARRHSLINESYIQHYAKALFLSLLGMDCGCTTLQETTVTGKDDKKVPGWTHQISSVRNQSLWLSRIMCPLVITHGLLKNPYIYIYCMCMYVYIYIYTHSDFRLKPRFIRDFPLAIFDFPFRRWILSIFPIGMMIPLPKSSVTANLANLWSCWVIKNEG